MSVIVTVFLSHDCASLIKHRTMKKVVIFISLISIIILGGCGTGKQLSENKMNADQFFASGNYGEALSMYKQIISVYELNNNSEMCPVYTNAGISALNSNNSKLAIDYLKKATYTQFADESTYLNLADVYGDVDNLSLEMMTLQDMEKKYPDSKNLIDVRKRLFDIYVESENYDKALEIWNNENVVDIYDINVLENYFKLNRGVDDNAKCEETASRMLDVDPENITALNFFGKKYYRKAEDRYQKEMKAYEKKKTNKQYSILLKALDQVTVDFKKSLKYFKKLYKVDPVSANANYLSHIYKRLGDKKNAAYYKKLAGK